MRGTVATVSCLVGFVVLVSAASAAHADEWYFSWQRAGACAPDRLTVGLEIRPELAVAGVDIGRVGCDKHFAAY